MWHKIHVEACKPSSMGTPQNDAKNERTVGLPLAHARSFTGVTRNGGLGGGGTTLFRDNKEPLARGVRQSQPTLQSQDTKTRI